MYHLLKIDELLIKRHKYLEEVDECYYIMDYPPYNKYGRTTNTCLIMDFKIPVDRKGKGEWPKKAVAINKISESFKEAVSPFFEGKEITLVPMPPSKIKTDPLYDDRIIQLLKNYCTIERNAEMQEAIYLKHNIPSAHNSSDRESPEELLKHLALNPSCSLDDKIVVIVDDVVTHGSHFKACKELILTKFRPKQIMGLFIGSTTF